MKILIRILAIVGFITFTASCDEQLDVFPKDKLYADSFFKTENEDIRKVALRTSIVLGNNGGAFTKLKLITKSENEIINSLMNDTVKIAVLPRKLSNNELKAFVAKKINPNYHSARRGPTQWGRASFLSCYFG